MLIPLCEVLAHCPTTAAAISVLVVGAGELEQKPEFDACGVHDVVWIEANPWCVTRAKDKFPTARIVCACVWSRRLPAAKFYEMQPAAIALSGLFQPTAALRRLYPHAVLRGHRFFKAQTVPDALASAPGGALLARKVFQLLVLDVNGAEMGVLDGMADSLPPVVHVRVYAAAEPVLFKRGATVQHLAAFFDAIGYTLKLERWAPSGCWGERVYTM